MKRNNRICINMHMYKPHFAHSFLNQRTFGLFPALGFCDYCCYEHSHTNICFEYFQVYNIYDSALKMNEILTHGMICMNFDNIL